MIQLAALAIFLFTSLSLPVTEANGDCLGCVELDSLSFDKVVSKFKASVVKFDVAYPYGEKHSQYGKLSEALAFNPDILVATAGVKDYGDQENIDLAQRYQITASDYPVVLLFLQGSPTPVRFQGEFTKDSLQHFVYTSSGQWTGLKGCLKEFDELSKQIISTEDVAEREKILRLAEKQLNQISTPEAKNSGEFYIKLMRKFIDKGHDFVQSELSRVNSLRGKKMAKDKKEQMQERLNILQSFHNEL